MKFVSIGGGAGVPHVMRGMRPVVSKMTGIVSTLDNGRSTRKAREIWHVPAPGDFRNAICELAVKNPWWARTFQIRMPIPRNKLDMMALGNAVLAVAGHASGGSMEVAMEEFNSLFLPDNERVWPSTLGNTHIKAQTSDRKWYRGEVLVRKPDKYPIVDFGLTKAAGLYHRATDAIDEADLVVIGPGSLFSSQLPFFYLNGGVEVLKRCPGVVGVIMNSTTQLGQTVTQAPDGKTYIMSPYDCLNFMVSRVGLGVIKFVLADDSKVSSENQKRLEESGRQYNKITPELKRRIESDLGIKVYLRQISEKNGDVRVFWNKDDAIIYHEPDETTKALVEIYAEFGQLTA